MSPQLVTTRVVSGALVSLPLNGFCVGGVRMLFGALADLVVVFHLAFIVFVVLGSILALRWRWIPWVHLPAVLWSTLLEICGWICPLTPLENWLRRAGGASEYSGGFVERYVVPIVYPAALTREA